MSKEPQDQDEYTEEEIVYDEDDGTFANKIKKVKEELKSCQTDKQEYLDGWQRSKADFVNFKKRTEEDKKNIIKFANEEIITELLATLDSFDMAFKNKEAWEAVSQNWRVGIEYIYNNLLGTLSNFGVKQLNPLDEDFDPLKHESVGILEGKEGKILEVVSKGYSLHDKIIRAPQVKIGEEG